MKIMSNIEHDKDNDERNKTDMFYSILSNISLSRFFRFFFSSAIRCSESPHFKAKLNVVLLCAKGFLWTDSNFRFVYT